MGIVRFHWLTVYGSPRWICLDPSCDGIMELLKVVPARENYLNEIYLCPDCKAIVPVR